MKISIVFLTLLATSVSIYVYATQDKSSSETDESEMEAQGNVLGTTEDDLQQEPTANVWYRDVVELQNFDLPLPATSLVGKQPEEMRDLFARNMVPLPSRHWMDRTAATHVVSSIGVLPWCLTTTR
jgi:type IV secretory pathway VirB10-like protein